MAEKDGKVDFFDKIVELYAWFEVVVASFIVGLIVASAIYFSMANPSRLYLAIASAILSLIIGAFIGNKNRKEKRKIHQDTNSVYSSATTREKQGHAALK